LFQPAEHQFAAGSCTPACKPPGKALFYSTTRLHSCVHVGLERPRPAFGRPKPDQAGVMSATNQALTAGGIIPSGKMSTHSTMYTCTCSRACSRATSPAPATPCRRGSLLPPFVPSRGLATVGRHQAKATPFLALTKL
jgi:hypothetical protein